LGLVIFAHADNRVPPGQSFTGQCAGDQIVVRTSPAAIVASLNQGNELHGTWIGSVVDLVRDEVDLQRQWRRRFAIVVGPPALAGLRVIFNDADRKLAGDRTG